MRPLLGYNESMSIRQQGPPSHEALRALLRIIDRAVERKDKDLLRDIFDLCDRVSPDHAADAEIYVYGLYERSESDIGYYVHDEKDIAEAQERLEKVAFGDFDEAMSELMYDLGSAIRYRSMDEAGSNIFRSDFFDDGDKVIWNELREVLRRTLVTNGYDEAMEAEADDAIDTLRTYQQKSYGPLIPTMTATYMKRTTEGAPREGVSVRLAWQDDHLEMETYAPFHKELEEYFANNPITHIDQFTHACFPEEMMDYELGDVADARLFAYELSGLK